MRKGTTAKTDSSAGVARVPWRVVEVRVLAGHQLFVRFADGTEGEVDTSPMVFGGKAGVFEQLRDPGQFAKAYIDEGVVAWPCGLDLAPDAMYDEIRTNGRWTIIR